MRNISFSRAQMAQNKEENNGENKFTGRTAI